MALRHAPKDGVGELNREQGTVKEPRPNIGYLHHYLFMNNKKGFMPRCKARGMRRPCLNPLDLSVGISQMSCSPFPVSS